MYLVTFPLAAIASTTLILRALATNTLVHRLMNNSVLRLYGKYSYGLYIYHVLLRQTVKRIFYPMFIGNMHSSIVSGAAYFVFCLMFLTALSVLSFQLYEAPFLRLKQYFSC